MGFLDYLRKQREKPSLGVCIPDRRQERNSGGRGEEYVSGSKASFEVSGVYLVGKETTVIGRVLEGTLLAKHSLKSAGKEIPVKEIMARAQRTEKLPFGESGSVYLDEVINVKNGDILHFG